MLEVPDDRDLDDEQHSDQHSQYHMDNSPCRELHLVSPQAWNHLRHQNYINGNVTVAENSMKQHEPRWRRTLQFFMIEGVAPQMVHQKRSGDGQYQKCQPEDCIR